MTMSVINTELISEYVSRVATGLRGLDEAAKRDILAEIESHISDRVEQLRQQGAMSPERQVLGAMGNPDALSRQFMIELNLQRSSRAFAPWALLRASWRFGLTGLKGLALFIAGVIGYSSAIAFLFAAAAKELWPNKVGFWIGSDFAIWGVKHASLHAHEYAGDSFVSLSLLFAVLSLLGTTLLLRRLLRSLRGRPTLATLPSDLGR